MATLKNQPSIFFLWEKLLKGPFISVNVSSSISTDQITLSLADISSWCLSGLQILCSLIFNVTVSLWALFTVCLSNLSFHPLSFPGWWSHVLNSLSLFTSGVPAVRRRDTFLLAASAQIKTLKDFDMLQGHSYAVIGKHSDFPGS